MKALGRPQFRLRTLLICFTVTAVAIVIFLQLQRDSLSAGLRDDLELKPHESLAVLESQSITSGGQKGLQHALIVISDKKEYRLARASRWQVSNPNLNRWNIDSVSIMTTNGDETWEFFERTFDHEPTEREIADFKRWMKQW